jgi:ABC-type microcin C transport system permease subunit YejB
MIGLRIIAGIILSIWLLLVLFGKGSFVHLLLLSGLGIASVDLMCVLRRRTFKNDE